MSDQPESVQRRRSMATGPTVAPVLPAAHATDPTREDSRVNRLVFAMAAVVGALAVPSFTGASGCPSTCGAAKRTCQLAGVTAFRSCRVTVKASGQTGQDRRGAIKSCRSAFRGAQQTCVASLHDCLHGCGAPPSSCPAGCASQGRMCLHDVVSTAQACVRACSPAPSRLQCVAACAATARAALEDCEATIHSCLAGCPSSPSGAFLD